MLVDDGSFFYHYNGTYTIVHLRNDTLVCEIQHLLSLSNCRSIEHWKCIIVIQLSCQSPQVAMDSIEKAVRLGRVA